MIEISEDTWNEELNKLFLVKIQITEDYTWQSTTWRSKIWNEETQNSALFESQRDLGSQRLQFIGQIKFKCIFSRRSWNYEYIYVADWRWRTIFIKKAMQEVAEKPKNWKTLQSGRTTEKQRRLEEFPTQHDQESRTVSLFFYDLDLLSSCDGPTFLIKLLSHRVQESPAAKLECREIHERICVFLETFLIVNLLDEILMNCTIIQEIWQHHRESLMMSRILRKQGIETSGSEEPLQSIPLPCFSVRARKKSRRQMSLVSMTNDALGIWTCTQVARQFRVISPRRCICTIPDRTKFQSWIVNFRAEVCAKARNKRKKSENILAPSGRLKNVFSGRQLGLVQEETLVVFYTCMPRETVRTTWNEVQIRKKSDLEQAYSSVPKVKKQTDETAWTV